MNWPHVMVAAIGIIATLGAILVMALGMEGWGWLIFIAVISLLILD